MTAVRASSLLLLAFVLGFLGLRSGNAHASGVLDSLTFAPELMDTASFDEGHTPRHAPRDRWLRPSSDERLLTDREEWRSHEDTHSRFDLLGDYNRVDRLRLGLRYEMQWDRAMQPRLGARVDYAFDRKRTLYGFQIEQPLLPPGRIAIGASMIRRTDHPELQQVENIENSLALLFGRQDYRDYFEREGFGAYVSWRVPDFSTVSIQLRNDEYRSLPLQRGTRSFFHRDRPLRDNPAIDDGESHATVLRLEHLAHPEFTRPGLYHWIDLERAGRGMGGDFDYTRLLVDVRSVFRLSPAATLALRGVAGHTFDGTLPAQKQFTLGGPDGLRAHAIAQLRGNEVLLGQAEYTIGLWTVRSAFFEGGLHAIAFVDLGQAWTSDAHHWDVGRQQVQSDGGFGLGTSEDNLRIYFARDLRKPDADFLVSMRLHRPF
jgi:hypothetical protein